MDKLDIILDMYDKGMLCLCHTKKLCFDGTVYDKGTLHVKTCSGGLTLSIILDEEKGKTPQWLNTTSRE